MRPRFEKNAPGDFYIENDCCVACGVMHDEAPDLLAWQKSEPDERGYVRWHCYVARQPETPGEIAQMIDAMEVGDVDCLRYGGADPQIMNRLSELGLAGLCDLTGPESGSPEAPQDA